MLQATGREVDITTPRAQEQARASLTPGGPEMGKCESLPLLPLFLVVV